MSQQDDFRSRIYGDQDYFNDLPPAGYEGIGGYEAQLNSEQDRNASRRRTLLFEEDLETPDVPPVETYGDAPAVDAEPQEPGNWYDRMLDPDDNLYGVDEPAPEPERSHYDRLLDPNDDVFGIDGDEPAQQAQTELPEPISEAEFEECNRAWGIETPQVDGLPGPLAMTGLGALEHSNPNPPGSRLNPIVSQHSSSQAGLSAVSNRIGGPSDLMANMKQPTQLPKAAEVVAKLDQQRQQQPAASYDDPEY